MPSDAVSSAHKPRSSGPRWSNAPIIALRAPSARAPEKPQMPDMSAHHAGRRRWFRSRPARSCLDTVTSQRHLDVVETEAEERVTDLVGTPQVLVPIRQRIMRVEYRPLGQQLATELRVRLVVVHDRRD